MQSGDFVADGSTRANPRAAKVRSVTSADRPPRRPYDAAASRADLLRAARARFAVLGYERATTRDIAADAGTNVSMIRRYFGSKEGLFQAVLDDAGSVLLAHGSTAGDLIDRLIDGLRPDAWPEYGHQHPLLLVLQAEGDDERSRQVRDRSTEAMLARLVNEATGQPGRTEEDLRLRAHLVLALLLGTIALKKWTTSDLLATADLTRLREPLNDAVDALLGPADRNAPAGDCRSRQ